MPRSLVYSPLVSAVILTMASSSPVLPACYCGATEYRTLARKRSPQFEIARCRCGLCRNLPVPYSDDASAEIYLESVYFHETGEGEAGATFDPERLDFLARHAPPGRLLDVGCSRGNLCRHAVSRGWQVVGCDVDAAAVRHGAAKFGLDLRLGPLETAVPATERFDALTLMHVLEHINDLDAFLQQCRERLVPGGRLLVEVPNIASPMFRLMGSRWLYARPDMHVWHFDPASLARALTNNGFTVLANRVCYRYWKRSIRGVNWRNTLFRAYEEAALLASRLVHPGDVLLCCARRNDGD